MKLMTNVFVMCGEIYFSIFLLKIVSILGYDLVVLGPRRSIYLSLFWEFSKENSLSEVKFTCGLA